MAKKVGTAGFNLLVIDTENKFVSTGFAEEIAKKAQVCIMRHSTVSCVAASCSKHPRLPDHQPACVCSWQSPGRRASRVPSCSIRGASISHA